ncbi:hypothetical protein SAMN05216490_1396 [Mucilaginibacter mallensis]|uniref:Lipocalin-like domain-containing protein n=1 Tax=Mucilaginibacter mallensis TaxID=652787 RepID=A0A1H1TA27_MUCMA|nr:hypothetical protein [Mucilaginibacter mallensis]SDS56968.1 hypothetical protein SAMN05216490_1396 [Mucilaginibacter mallensis]
MNLLKYSILIALLGVMVSGCSKDAPHKAKTPATIATYNGPLNGGTIADGTYSGLLLADEKDGGFNTGPITRSVSYSFNNSNYTTVAAPAGFTAASKGVYTLSGNKIALTDSLVHTANFDWNLILVGSYSYNVNADSLIITKTSGTNTYTYKLKRQ